jgi:hypothetical protein
MAIPFIRVFSDALKATGKSKRLWLLHFIVNAALIVGAALWLRIPDASAWQLLFAAIAALVLVVAALWLHSGTLAYFLGVYSPGEASLAAGFKTGRRHLAGFALWSAIFAFVIYLIMLITGPATATDAFASWLRSIMPAFLRRLITLGTVDSIVSWVICLVLFVLVPGLLLPFAVQFAGHGFSAFGSGFKAWRQTVSKISYWVWFCILALLGIYLPNRIANWVPGLSSLPLEHLSVAVRFTLAFALAVTAWLILASMLGRLGSGAGGESTGGNATA